MIPSATLRLQINQTFAKIGLDYTKPVQEISQPYAQVEIVQQAAKMDIDQGAGRLSVDGEAAHAALSHKSALGLVESVAAQTRQVVMEFISSKSSEGDQLAAINKASIADIASQRYHRGPSPIEFIGPFSYNPVDVSYTPHPTTVSWQVGGADIQVTPHKPEISYRPGAVQAYVAQQNDLSVDVRGTYMNLTF
ncbi:MAG TPA: DUF6470 family protein [Bacilli bacterium]|nr:DUF6470 family protein [Bacilli bacterium]